MAGKTYISDMGVNHELVDADGRKTALERYGVWQPGPKGEYGVVEVSDDLDALLEKYGTKREDVVLIGQKKNSE